ncbi:MAG: hypothetical protein KUF72_03750 [Candidatus Thiodiazotropha sp. (ex Ctena orbiculata)]|nr:hypothetical protein [Candidatus Thiodiazotropha taylori]
MILITGGLAVLPLMRPVSIGKPSAGMSYLVLKTGEGLKIDRNTELMKTPYVAKLIGPSGIVQVLEFWAADDEQAWHIAHENVDPLRGGWVEVKPMPDTQESMDLFIGDETK